MSMTMEVPNVYTIQEKGIDALMKTLGPVGAIRFLEQYDQGGSGDYTREKYEDDDITEEEFLRLRDAMLRSGQIA